MIVKTRYIYEAWCCVSFHICSSSKFFSIRDENTKDSFFDVATIDDNWNLKLFVLSTMFSRFIQSMMFSKYFPSETEEQIAICDLSSKVTHNKAFISE